MAANPLTYGEIEAYGRLRLVRFSAWEVETICRVDDAVLGVWAAEMSKSGTKTPAADEEHSVRDTGALRSMFDRIGARFAGKKRRR